MEGVGASYGDVNPYYYHPDHLGSVHSVTYVEGEAYERIKYTPFGEMWVEIREDNDTAHLKYIPFRFTAKEWDQETGLYYYGARYMDPRTSRWMSGDPAGFELINPMDGEGKARSGYSVVEATGWYSYVSNNPVRYVDPTGNQQIPGRDRALYLVPDSVVTGWIGDWVNIKNEIGQARLDIGVLRVESLGLAAREQGVIDEATIKLGPFVVAGILEASSTGSVQTLAETAVEAQFYAEELIEIKKREFEIPGEIQILESEIESKQQIADNLMNLIEGQAKLDLWIKEGEQ